MACASASIILKKIDEVCQCCICLQQYQDPRQLACLHRYCKSCLDQLIGRCDGKINCPLCQAEYKVPDNGAEGFKKDFFMNEILEFIQVQNSLEEDQSRNCVGCSKQEKPTAYCFKCRDFLCSNCHTYHMTSKFFEEHRPCILTLNNVDFQNISIEKLCSLKEDPRCQTHPENVSQLCCKTCEICPICVTCTHGEHKNHDIVDVVSFANAERKRLKRQLDELIKCKEDFYEKSVNIENAKQHTISDAETKLKDANTRYQQELEKVNTERKTILEEGLHAETEINKNLEANSLIRKQDMEEKMEQIWKDFKTLDVNAKLDAEAKVNKLKDNQNVKESILQNKQEQLDKKWDDFCKCLEAEKNDKLKNSNDISDQVQSTIKRCENITQTVSGVLASDNNWTIAQNVDGIFAATESLTQDMKKTFSGMDTLSESLSSTLSFKGFVKVENIRISEHSEKMIEIKGHRRKWKISGITCITSGSIVLTGYTAGFRYHVTVVSQNGNIVKDCLLNCSLGHSPESHCAALHRFQVVIVCDPNWIGIFDVRNGSIMAPKYMSDIVDWPDGQSIRSVSVDEELNDIIVGCGYSNNVYVLNDQLNYRRTLKLEINVTFLTDVFINNGYMVVCDFNGKRVLVVNMDGSLQYQMSSPVLTSKHPVCVRRDQNGFVYVLWSNVVAGLRGSYIIAQYSNDMRLLLRTKTSHINDISCFTVAQLDATDKLMMISGTNWKIYQYGLYPDEEEDN